ncbi:chemoreceptor glutamine deamidase CheD [Chelatococcus sp. SYSU_G07232]|uniref:Probable chemoreceptor glutamine deamidase CheD n=1 Tax=Chelatococcus albus TaxID=3047466 RepID=A0ABT7AFA2_9HYPH|nr:chemoreceptor glutamine deamidase CheD [Chelatococcus sp. SYSU_G07232]MDJ1158044.1 chemoreceptor glutamine deamidase CheD [Chelatococcus sp. SYSU_G07232]
MSSKGAVRPATTSRRYFDPRFDATIITVAPGDHEVTTDKGEVLATVLGSCVSACVRDKTTGVGGLNHFLLPQVGAGPLGPDTAGLCYGDTAMEVLLNALFKRGAQRQNLEAKIFGGARVLAGPTSLAIGQRNIAFVQEFLARERIPVASSDVGGDSPRRIHFHPHSGRVWVQHVDRPQHANLAGQEMAYLNRVTVRPVAGSVEIFE